MWEESEVGNNMATPLVSTDPAANLKRLHENDSEPSRSDGPHTKQKTLHAATTVNQHMKQSLQDCTPEICMKRLTSKIALAEGSKVKQKYQALQAVLQHLMTPTVSYIAPTQHKRMRLPLKGFLQYKDAFEIFLSHLNYDFTDISFRDNLLDEQHGLPVVIVQIPMYPYERYIILTSENIDILQLCCMWISVAQRKEPKGYDTDPDTVNAVLRSMNTEHDRACGKFLFSLGKSRRELEHYNFDIDILSKNREKLIQRVHNVTNTCQAAEDLVVARLIDKSKRLQKDIKENERLILQRGEDWPQHKFEDAQEHVKLMQQQLAEVNEMQERDTKKAKQKFNQTVQRTARQLVLANRITHRQLGAGAPRLLDSDDEEFIRTCIEEKASSHGGRHNTTLFLHRRLKCRDLRGIANFNLNKRRKRLIRSATSVYNRCRPRNLRSFQSRKHIGKGLFCLAKPPKAEDKYNELTHHQRAHVKNIYMYLFKDEDSSMYALVVSMDDKAYLRPGTSEGFEKTRNHRLLTLADEGARQLPKYDWPESMVYITPSTHRVMTKKPILVEGKTKVVVDKDNHFVVVRPKAIVDSSGTTWASEAIRIRCTYPTVYEVPLPQGNMKYSDEVKGCVWFLRYACLQYKHMTTNEDIGHLTNSKDCPHRRYEHQRVKALLCHIAVKNTVELPNAFKDFCKAVETVEAQANFLEVAINGTSTVVQKELFSNLADCCANVITEGAALNLPKMKPRIAEMTDAGPGVGVSNTEVRFRCAETVRLLNLDYLIRCHRARDDSSMNEAERTNSAIGDAVVDGSTIPWEHEKRFNGMTPEEIKEMSITEYNEYENNRMYRNAWHVAREVRNRVDTAPIYQEFIHGLLSEHPSKHFFSNKDGVKSFAGATGKKRVEIPGSGYLKEVFIFIDLHFERGELYIEFVRGGCIQKLGHLCSYCSTHGWEGPVMERIPRPMPDESRLPGLHYCKVFDTPNTDSEGQPRQPDDFNPRAQIKIARAKGTLSLDDPTSLKEFSEHYAMEQSYVEEYLAHLNHLDLMKEKRARARKEEVSTRDQLSYNDYDWDKLVTDEKLGTLKVPELKKYLTHHHLPDTGTKIDKVRTIIAHLNQDYFLSHASVRIEPDCEEDQEEHHVVLLEPHADDTSDENEELSDDDVQSTSNNDSSSNENEENDIEEHNGDGKKLSLEDTYESSDSDYDEMYDQVLLRTRSGRSVKSMRHEDFSYY